MCRSLFGRMLGNLCKVGIAILSSGGGRELCDNYIFCPLRQMFLAVNTINATSRVSMYNM
ncbi:hypothetical protein CRM22_000397 [Opisthorchis felineus]|uniref:Uncharacterized protein n=1 Tax=Opisthorchis felineus TaxID=147828 RepID=A0A4S2MFH5_OPIFE|nr:hypothetical protein CRM22_000397 [Opisthorchis felineus]